MKRHVIGWMLLICFGLPTLEPASAEGVFHGSVDYLYFWATGADSSYVSDFSASQPNGRSYDAGTPANSAFRLNLGYCLPSRADLRFRYTMFDGTSFDSRVPVPGSTLATVRLHPDNDSRSATGASASTQLEMHVFDLELGNWFCLTECIAARPFMGVRATDFGQSLETSFTVAANQRSSLDSINLTGVGLRAGSDVHWQFLPNVRVEGGVAGSILMGNCKTRHMESGSLSQMDINDNYLLGVPIAEIYVGLAYQFESIFIAAGLETSAWFNTGSYSYFVDDISDASYNRSSNDFMLGAAYFRAGWTW